MTTTNGAPRKRLRHRIPVRLRHNWKLVAGTCAFLLVLTAVFGTGMIRPYATSAASTPKTVVTQDVQGDKDLFDTTIAHDVRVEFGDANYRKMLQEYFDSGEKDYLPATVVIDGTRLENVGIRLKGNSTLGSLTWNGQRREGGIGGRQGGGRMPGGFQPPGGMQPPEGVELPEGVQPPAGFPQPGGQEDGLPGAVQPGGEGRMGGFGAALKAEEPETLPWLISFDEYVEGRRYQNHTQIAVRPGTTESAAQLNEALAISLVGAAGEPSQRYAYSGFTVNDRASAPRLLVEYLDEGYAEDLGDGVLYKSLATGQFSYQGEDQTAYGDDFKQVDNVGGTDLQPVINLIKWVEEASDEQFAAGLGERLEVESFARYIALQNIVMNFDDMAGPGKNYYLWYDHGTRRFTVVSWDMNLTFTGDATAGPHDASRLGGGRLPANDTPLPGGAQPPTGAQPPAGVRPGGSGQPPDGGQFGGMRMGNKLKERFLAHDAFRTIYEQQYRAVYAATLDSGKAKDTVTAVVSAYQLNQGAKAAVQAEASTLQSTLDKRVAALSADEVIKGG